MDTVSAEWLHGVCVVIMKYAEEKWKMENWQHQRIIIITAEAEM